MRNLKNFLIVCTFFVALALLASCASAPAPEIAATEAPTATPSPTATPAPISFEAAAEANRTELRTFSDYGSVFSAVQESKAEGDGADVPAHSSALRAAASPEELTESDILRVDGEYIYTLTDKNLTIFHLSGEAGELISHYAGRYRLEQLRRRFRQFAGSERTPLALFLRGSRLAVLLTCTATRASGARCAIRNMPASISTTFPIRTRLCSSRAPVRAAYTRCVDERRRSLRCDGLLRVGRLPTPQMRTSSFRAYIPPRTAACLRSKALTRCRTAARAAPCSAATPSTRRRRKCRRRLRHRGEKRIRCTRRSFPDRHTPVSAESRRMSDSVGDYTEYVELLCTDLFRFDFDASGIRPAASGVVSGLLPEKSAIAPFGSGYVCLSEVSGSYINMYVGKGGPAPAAEQTGSALYTLDAALTVTAKSPSFRTATVSSGRASRRKPCCSPARTDPAPPISRSRHDHRRARRRCDPGGCAASVEKRRLCRLPA